MKKTENMKYLKAYEKIRDLILSGKKLPGTRLVLADLEAELQIGRGALREALLRLDRSGLVRNIPYKGAVVASPPKQKEIEYIYKMRADIEVELALVAMERMDDSDFTELENIYGEMVKLKSTNEGFFALDRQFHLYIAEKSDMSHLYSVLEKLLEFIEMFLSLYQYKSNDCVRFNEEHAQIVSALREKNAEVLAEVLSANIRGGLGLVGEAYDRIRCSTE
ncbi:GntR family transcriptional regulator [Halodesulfovibrio spirochaetisodalis]|uniref:GntR family transcriptional regulator n=1 Tax=Halodesulfovibrio spirochaetisodalis TaxID=1560234 RepID=UPI00082999DA|nr:GntR family transcriptional regulator [Halodesulfovibrio spirochaetisodalis]